MNNISVTPKGGTIASQLSGSDVNLTAPSLVKLNLNRSDIKSFARNGNDLVVTTKSGETVVIHNFYSPAGESDLVLQDDQGALWWVEDPGQQGFQFVSIDSTEGLLADNITNDGAIAAYGFGGAALAGIAAMFAGGGGGGGNSSETGQTPGDGGTGGGDNGGGDNGGGDNGGGDNGGGDNGGGDNGGGDNGGGDNGGGDDTTAPGPVTDLLISDNVGSIQGAIGAGSTTDDNTPTLSGTAEAGAVISVYDGTTLLGTVTVNADGTWSFTSPALADGQHSLTVTVTDAAGNVSSATPPFNFTVDTLAPEPIADLTATSDNGTLVTPIGQNSATSDNTPTLQGTAEAGSTVTIRDGDTVLGTVTAGSDGRWSFTTSALGEGSHTLSITATDAAGNVSAATTLTFTVDTVAPDAASGLQLTDNVGDSQGPIASGGSTDDSTPVLSGAAEAGTVVSVYDGDTLLGTVTAGADGSWSFTTPALSNGSHSLTVTVTDAAGNVSAPTTPIVINVAADLPPATSSLEITDDSGSTLVQLANGAATADNTPTLSGLATPGALITLYNGDDVLGSVTADANGQWAFTPATLGDGTYAFHATSTDAEGNVTETPTITITIDTLVPDAAGDLQLSNNGGETVTPVNAGGASSDNTPVLSGTAEPGSTISIFDGTTLLGSTTVGSDGSWSFTTPVLAEGNHSLTTTVTDAAGNVSDPTAPLTFTVDTLPPAAASGLVVTDDVGDSTGPLTSGATTDDSTPILSGQAEPDSVITVYDGSVAIGSVTVGTDGNWSFTTPALSNGSHSLTLTVTDAAGNTSPATEPFELTVAAGLPPATTSLEITDDSGSTLAQLVDGDSTKDSTPVLTGLTMAGALVTLYNGDEVLGSVTADANGQWSFTPDALVDGTYAFHATSTDATGNVTDSATLNITIDTVAPESATGIQLSTDASGTPVPVTAGTTNDATPVLSGSAEPGSVVTVTDGTTVLGSVTVGTDGNWSFTTPALTEGDHSLTATVTDPAGNASAPSAPINFTLDTTPPAAAADLLLSSNSGGVSVPVGAGGATNDTSPVLSGSAEPGSVVTVSDGDTVLGSVTAGGDGSWSFTVPALDEGDHSLTTTVTDVAGNTGPASTPIDFTLDTTAPDAASGLVVTDDVGNSQGELASGDTTDDSTPTLSGQAEAGSVVNVYDGNTLLGSATADANGGWSFTTPTLSNGDHSLTVTVTDTAGNVSAPTGAFDLTVAADLPPATSSLEITDDSGSTVVQLTNGATTPDTTPVLSGLTTANALVTLYNGDQVLGSVTADANGQWTFTPDALADGTYAFHATSTDSAGNVTDSGTLTITIDSVAPDAVGNLQLSSDASGTVVPVTAGATNDASPILSGSAEPGSIVTVLDGTTVLGSATVGEDGSWSFTTPALAEGAHSLTATVTDAAGNSSVPSAPVTFDVDTTPPAVVADLLLSDNRGILLPVAPGGTTNDTSPILSGTAEAGSTVTVSDGNTVLGSVAVGSDGSWSFTTPALGEGNHSLTATVTDAAGNVGPASPALGFTVDTAAPAAAGALVVTDDFGTAQGALTSGDTTDDRTPTLSGQAEPNAVISIYDGTTLLGNTTVDVDGNWSFTTPVLSTGDHSLTVTVTDVAGNVSPATDAFELTIEGGLPPATTPLEATGEAGNTLTPLVDGATTNNDSPILSGVADPNSLVTLYDGNTLLGSVTADANGQWSFRILSLSNGLHVFLAVINSPNGSSTNAGPLNITVDTLAPDAADNLQLSNNEGSASLPVSAGGATNDASPVLSGTAEPGSTVTVSDGATLLGSTTVNSDGSWSFTSPVLAEGAHSLTTTVTDLAGNSSAPSAPVNFTVDTTAPAAATGLVVSDNVGDVQGALTSGATTDDSTPTLSGQAEAGSVVSVYDGDVLLGTVTAGADGSWSLTTTALSNGLHSLTVTVTDAAGNVSLATPAINLNVQADLPPAATSLEATDDSGTTLVALADGATTQDATPVLSGLAAAGSLVTLYSGDTVLGSVTADANGQWTFTPATLADGTYTFLATFTDAAGNVTDSAPLTLTIDTTPPEAATGVTLTDANGDPVTGGTTTNTSAPVLSGSAEAGSLVTVSDGTTVLGSVTAGTDGSWSFTTPTLTEGDHSLTATVTDPAGNVSPASEAIAITVDTLPPAIPADLLLSSDQGGTTVPVTSGGATSDTTPVLSGSAEPGSLVIVSDGDTVLGSVTAADDGSWSFTTPALDEGDHSLTATVTDAAGNSSAPSAPVLVTVDTTPPVAAADLLLSNDQSGTPVAVTGGITNDPTPVLSGTAEAGTLVTVSDGDTVLGSVTVGSDGSWSFTAPALSEGDHSLTATVTDTAGNVSPASEAIAITVSTTPPVAADNLLLTNDQSGAPVVSGGLTNDATPVLSGTAAVGSTVTVYDGETLLGTTTADAEGNWRFTSPELDEGSHSLTATVTDAAGNVSAPTEAVSFTVDTLPPVAAAELALSNDQNGTAITAGGTTNDTTPVLSGSAEPGSIVTVFDGEAALGSATVDAEGNWRFTPDSPLDAGAHSLTVTVTDAAGNAGPASDPFTFTVDLTPPAAAANLQISNDASGTPVAIAAGGATNDTTPLLSGTAEAGSTITVSDGDTVLGSTTVNGDGSWSFSAPTLSEGEHSLSVVVTNPTGNSSAPSEPVAFTVDTSAPATAIALQLSSDDNGNQIAAGGATNDITPVLSGTAEAGSLVTVSDGTTVLGSVTAGTDGSWRFTSPALAEGDHSLTATVTDAAGNVSAPSEPFGFNVDLTAPALADNVQLSYNTGTTLAPIADGGFTNDTTPQLTGTAEANSIVTVYDGDAVLGSVTAGADGSWSFTPAPALDGGPHSLSVTVTDPAGNVSGNTAAIGFTVDTDVPAAAVDLLLTNDASGTEISDGDLTNDNTPVLSGSAEAGSTVNVFDGDTLLGTATVDETGAWRFTSPTLNDGDHSLSVTVTDAAGNTSPASDAISLSIDTQPPAAITGLALANIADGGLTNINAPTISGVAEAGTLVTVSDGDTVLGSVTAGTDGSWSFTSPALDDGSHTLSVTAADAAGNISAATTVSLVVDATPPAVAADLSLSSDNGSAAVDILDGDTTSDSTPLLSGTAEAGSIVTVYDGQTLLGTTTVGANGQWNFAVATLGDGGHSLNVTVTDAAGNVSAASTPIGFTVDTVAPDAAEFTVSNDSGPENDILTAGAFTSDNTPLVTGTAEPNSLIIIYDGDAIIGSTTASGTGDWTFSSPALADGLHNLSVTVTDEIGNVSPRSGLFSFNVDVTPPEPVTALTLQNSSGTTLADGAFTNDTAPVLSGTAEANALVRVYDGETELGSVTADANGDWRFTPSPALSEAAHTLSVTVTDAAGNVSASSPTLTVTVDTTAPDVAIINIYDTNGSTPIAIANGASTDDQTPVLRGTAEAGTTVNIYQGGELIGSATANESGIWRFETGTLAEGQYSFTVSVTDAAGNTGIEAEPYTINVDLTPPVAIADLLVSDNAGATSGPLVNGATTDDNTPTLSGTAELGSIVTIYDGATLLGSVVTGAGGSWSFTTATLSNGPHSFTVTQTDAAGNVGPATDPFAITIANGLPPTTSTLQVSDDSGSTLVNLESGASTRDTTPVLSGVADQGDVITIYDGDTVLGNVTVGASGVWSFTPATALAQGDHAFRITTADATGNAGAPAGPVAIIIDTTVPATVTDLLLSNNNGTAAVEIAAGSSTNDNTPLLSGTTEANGLVTVYDGDNIIGSTTADSAGAWSFTAPLLTNGAHALSVAVTDVAGNVGARSEAVAFTVDTIAPAPATGLTLTNDATSTVVPNGGTTNDSTPVLSGSAEAGSLVTVYDGTAVLGSVTAGTDGAWSFTSPVLGQGLHSLNVRVTDVAGNTSVPSGTATVVVDTLAPTAVTLSASNNNGATATPIQNNGITNDSTPALTGTAEAGSRITISDGTTVLGSVTAGSNGQWSFISPTLADGAHTLSVIATDAAGNSSAPTTLTLTVATTAPAPVAELIVNDNVGAVQGALTSGAFTDDTTPTLSGTAGAGNIVTVYDGTTLLGTVTAGSDGTWSFTTGALAQGAHTLNVTATNAAGNVSPTTAFNLTVDTVAPVASTLVITNDAAGVVVPNGGATNDSTPVLSGAAEAGSVVTIFDGTTTLGSVTVGAGGTWSFTPAAALNEGTHPLRVTVTDAAGNVSGSTSASVIIDTTPPAVTLAASNNNGTTPVAIANNGLTNDSTPALSGTAEAGSRLTISDGTTVLGTVTAGSNGQWSFVSPTLADGAHTLNVTATDAVGNTSSPVSLTLNVDTTPPAAVTGLEVRDNVGTIQGLLANGAITDDNTPTLSGRAEAGTVVTIFDGTTALGSVTAGADGAWSFTTAALNNGVHPLSVTVRDAAGNTSAASATVSITVDTVAPGASTLVVTNDVTGTVVANGGSTNDSTPTLSGSAEAGSRVTIYDGTQILGTATVGTGGTWSFTTSALDNGTHPLSVTVTDVAGNVSSAATASVVIDTTAPAAVTALALSNNNGSTPVAIPSGGVTNDSTPLLSGAGEAGARISVFDGANLLGTTTVGSNGQWSFVSPTLSNGPHTLNVTATDAAGNSSPNASVTLTVDTIAPAASTLVITNDSVTPNVTVPSGGATRDTTPVLSGTAEAGALVRIFDGTTLLGSVTAGTGGAWSFTTATLSQGTHPLSVTVTDTAGNVSSTTSASVVVDSVAPTAVSGLAVNAAGTTLTGIGEAGATVTVRDAGGNAIGSGTVATNGSFSVTLTTAQTTGATLSVTQVDSAGNVSPAASVLGAIRVVATNDVTEVDYATQTGTITNANTSTSGIALLNVNLGGAVTLGVLQNAGAYQFSVGAGDTRSVTLHASATSLVALTSTYTLYLYQQQANGTWIVKSTNANYISTFLTVGTQSGGNVTYSNLGTGNYAVLLGTSSGVGVLPSTTITTTSDITTLAVTVAATVTGNLLTNDTSSVAGTIPTGTLVTTVSGGAIASTGNTVINTTYGTLTVDAKGNYTYALKAGLDADTVPATDVFTYSVRDASGTVTTATLTVDLHNGPAATLLSVNSLFTETGLDEGTTASGSIYGDSTATHTGALSITNESGQTTAIGSSGITLVAGDYGTLSISADGHYTYALNSAVNAQAIVHKEVFSYSLTAADGSVTTNSFTIELHPTINGTAGADALTSSAYDDTITAGAGADTLVYHLLNSADAVGGNGHDTWTDFSVANGDKIDVSSLLVGWNDSSSNVNDFVKVDHTADGNTVLSIDRDGTGTAYSSTQLVTLEGVNVSLEELLQQPHQNPTV